MVKVGNVKYYFFTLVFTCFSGVNISNNQLDLTAAALANWVPHQLYRTNGWVQVNRNGVTQLVTPGYNLFPGTLIRVQPGSRAIIKCANNSREPIPNSGSYYTINSLCQPVREVQNWRPDRGDNRDIHILAPCKC